MEENQHNSEDEIDRSISPTPRRLSEHLDHSLGTVSFVWNYFIKNTDYKNNKKATCNHCKNVYIYFTSSTSGITKHLKNVHSIVQHNKPISDISVLFMLQVSKVIFFIFFFI